MSIFGQHPDPKPVSELDLAAHTARIAQMVIDKKDAEIASLRAEVGDLREYIARLRAALHPFAALATKLDGADNLVGLITEDQFRIARSVYEYEQGAGK